MSYQPNQEVFLQVQNNDEDAIHEWVENQAGDLNIQDSNNNQLLGIALLNHHWGLANYFIEHGANLEALIREPGTHDSKSPLKIAMQYAQWELVEKLIRRGANPKDYINHVSPLHYFSKMNNIGMVNFILSSNIPDIVDYPPHNSPLKAAIIAGHLNIVEILVTGGASISNQESLDESGAQYSFTPIQYAAMFGHRDIVGYLIALHTHQHGFADDNMGPMEAMINMNEVVANMLPYNRNTFNYSNDLAGQQGLRVELLLLQACTKHYTLQRAVPRIFGNRTEIRQRSDQYYNRALLALDVIDRSLSTQSPPIVALDLYGSDRITSLQKMMFASFCTSITTYVQNHPDINTNNPVWKIISYLGGIIDCAADRGYFHHNHIIRTNARQFIDIAWENILASIQTLKDFVIHRDDRRLQTLKTTQFYKISAYLNDCEQLLKLEDTYLCFNETDLQSNEPSQIEAALNAIAATLEIVTVHLSEFSRAYFHDLDFESLSQVRNHLRHVNGDNNHHDAFAAMSRARRFENLIIGQNTILMNAFIHFMRHDFSEIRERVKTYKSFVDAINTPEILYQNFTISTGKITDIKNTLWSYYNFIGYRRNVLNLRTLLEEHDDSNYTQENPVQKALRTRTAITAITVIEGRLNEPHLREWNARVRETLDLAKRKIEKIQPVAEKKRIKSAMQRLLPNQEDKTNLTVFSSKIHCYLRYAANIHYAILNLQRIINIKRSIEQNNTNILERIIPESSSTYKHLSKEEQRANDALGCVLKRNSLIRYNVMEWYAVHFYEHLSELIEEKIFLNTYHEHHGDTTQLLLDIEQIRNYVAHVANLKFVNEQGSGINQTDLFNLCQHANDMLEGLQRVQKEWQILLEELIAIIPQEKIQEFSTPQSSGVHNTRFCGFTYNQLLKGASIMGAVVIGYSLKKGLETWSVPKLKL